jgi:L-ascorbate metabolism protein UlaG (beta-lactamase superfamily)
MNSQEVYLKQNVLAEPLFNQWYAWPYLISPATAAMYIAFHHIKSMQSFVSNPEMHIAALKTTAMLGGPFINYGVGKVKDIKELLEKTLNEQRHIIEFAEAVKKLDQMLIAEATGYSLEPFYERIPKVLKGYVELVYDLNNHPSFRLIEALLYKSKYYNQSSQSITLSTAAQDERHFVFSTPRIDAPGQLSLNIPFSHEGIDELFSMRHTPKPFGQIKETLGVKCGDEELFASFFTQAHLKSTEKYDGDKLRIRYFGHACIFLETRSVSVLIDPVISYGYDNGIRRFLYNDLPPIIDYILITHNHQDHCVFETLLQLRHKIRNIVVPKNNGGSLSDPSMRMILQNIGFKNVREIDELESIEIDGGFIVGLPFLGEHADLNIRSKTAHLVILNGKSLLCAADSNNIEPVLYEYLSQATGNIDILFLGMECDGAPMSWLYGPLLTKPLIRKMDQSRRFDGSDCTKGLSIVNQLRPKEVYVYAMGREPWLTFLTSIQYTEESRPIIESNKLVEECKRRGIVSETLFGQKELFL